LGIGWAPEKTAVISNSKSGGNATNATAQTSLNDYRQSGMLADVAWMHQRAIEASKSSGQKKARSTGFGSITA
jgi:hypothetical protein